MQKSDDIEAIKAKIAQAQRWALKHFNTANANDRRLIDENLNFLPPSMFVEFPDVDTMVVAPSIMGVRSFIEVHYRLAFYQDGSMAWIGKHPIYNYAMPPLKIQ